jgi:hypothetical protein
VTDNLERALGAPAEGPGVWVARLEGALIAVQRAILSQASGLGEPGGGLVGVGADQAPSPGLDRRLGRLLDDLSGLLEESRALRAGARDAALGDARALDGLRQRGRHLLGGLRRHEREEVRLVLESVTTDIGAGD